MKVGIRIEGEEVRKMKDSLKKIIAPLARSTHHPVHDLG